LRHLTEFNNEANACYELAKESDDHTYKVYARAGTKVTADGK
jgi:hypothetical protein